MLPRIRVPAPQLSPWTAFLVLASIVVNVFFHHLRPLSPATLIYDTQATLLSVSLSPFLIPTRSNAFSRLAQLCWIAYHPSSKRTGPGYLAGIYASLVLVRCGSGYLLSRSVGWAYPQLFSHTALYEPIFGLGPLLVGAILFDDLQGGWHVLRRLAAMAIFSSADCTPWTYMHAALLAGAYRLFQHVCLESTTLLPSWSSTSTIAAFEEEKEYTPQILPLTRSRIIALALLAAATCGVGGSFPALLDSIADDTPTIPSGVHIVMLTVPRMLNLSSDVMIESIASYVDPWAAQFSTDATTSKTPAAASAATGLSLTVFAHRGADGTHPAFERAKAHFAAAPPPTSLALSFHMQPPNPDAPMNHYVHLADAAQYAYEHAHGGAGQAWTMFVEDDFVLCGDWGMAHLARVVAHLNDGERDPARPRLNGAFVGTGGRYVQGPLALLLSVPFAHAYPCPAA